MDYTLYAVSNYYKSCLILVTKTILIDISLCDSFSIKSLFFIDDFLLRNLASLNHVFDYSSLEW